MNHPEHILRTLDSHLAAPTRLILYGRAALALGYPDPLPCFHATMDVDAILPEIEMTTIEADESFWNAIEKTNHQLHTSGLYLTHLFADSQVILRSDWLQHIVPIQLPHLRFLHLFRPSTLDLILTKMMRVDPQDRNDIGFLIRNVDLHAETLDTLFRNAEIPDIPEIQQAFENNRHWLHLLLSEA